MSPLARRCSRLVPLLTVLWAAGRGGATQSQPAADPGTCLDSDTILRLSVHDVNPKIQPPINQLVSRIDRLDSRIDRLDSWIDRIDSRIDNLDSQLISFDTSLKGIETRLYVDVVQALVHALDVARVTFDAKLEEHTSSVESTERRLESRLDELVSQVNSAEGRLDIRLDELVSRANYTEGSHDSRLDQLVSREHPKEGRLDSRLDELVTRVESMEDRIDSRLDQLVSRVNGLAARRIDRLDSVTSLLDGFSSLLDELSNGTDPELTARDDSLSRPPLPRDCSDLLAGAQSGIHLLQLGLDRSQAPVPAYCDLDSDGGGWTVIQRRADIDPRQDFNLDWSAYREGFGELDAEFWWGLERLWKLTGPADRQYELRVNLADFDGERRHANYSQFRVASEADGYRLTVSNYTGNAGDSLRKHNGYKFSTRDKDQDGHKNNCAQDFKAGWWYSTCYHSLLNGPYRSGKHKATEAGVNWNNWRGGEYSLKEAEMKIRPVNTYS